jgi:hypothetical protein
MLPTREADAWGRATGARERPVPRGLPPLRERQAREAGQEDPAESFVTCRCPRLRSGRHTLRLRGERGRGLGRYHLRRKGHPLTLHLRLGGAAGTRGGSSRGGRGQGGVIRMQPPRRPLLPDSGRLPGPLQLMGPGDPMQRLALMMAVMMLGMPPVNGYHTDIGPGEQGARGRTESMFPPLCVDRE